MRIKTRLMRSVILPALCLISIAPSTTNAITVKRTILTSGETVYPVKYRVGQSTLIYLGFRPETVICGNKNYFNIEKFKDGITIQPLSQISTNLTVIDRDRRYLFYLTPALNENADGFIDAKWIQPSQTHLVAPSADDYNMNSNANFEKVIMLNESANFLKGIEVKFTRLSFSKVRNRMILDFTARNSGHSSLATSELNFSATEFQPKNVKPKQILIWESETSKPDQEVRGRIILNDLKLSPTSIIIGNREFSKKIELPGSKLLPIKKSVIKRPKNPK